MTDQETFAAIGSRAQITSEYFAAIHDYLDKRGTPQNETDKAVLSALLRAAHQQAAEVLELLEPLL